MAHVFYSSRVYRQKQSAIIKAAWERGVFDFTKKREERSCKRKECGKIFIATPSNPKVFCSQSCAATVNNQLFVKRIRLPRVSCLNCGKVVSQLNSVFCSRICRTTKNRSLYIKSWKEGKVIGLDKTLGVVSFRIKKYLREKYKDRCCLCGWSKINPKTGKVPLVADHIDGNWQNNKEENLRLLCPNCDSLTSTYGSLNRGRGRKNRVLSRRSVIGRSAENWLLWENLVKCISLGAVRIAAITRGCRPRGLWPSGVRVPHRPQINLKTTE